MTTSYVINVTEADFEYEVIQYSQNVPVVVDFWAEWCIPCKTLGPILTRLAEEAQGAFRLAKVDVDQSPNLAMRYGVRSIPNVKAFRNGQVVGEFTGLIPETRVREFIGKLAPSESSLDLEKADSLLQRKLWIEAENLLRDILDQDPDHPSAMLGLAKALLAQGQGRETLMMLRGFPASKEYTTAELLVPLAEAIIGLEKTQPVDDDPLASAFNHAIRLASRGNIYSALDGLLDIIRQDKRYRNGSARQIYLALLELLGETDPQTRQYRSDLASLLF